MALFDCLGQPVFGLSSSQRNQDVGQTPTMISTLLRTIREVWHVRGTLTAPPSIFPLKLNPHRTSDMFRLAMPEQTVRLCDFQYAFFTSPVFQTELRLLSLPPIQRTYAHLQGIAEGDQSSLGPWTAWAVDGSRTKVIGPGDSACAVMRCTVNGRPFCDTWWCVEQQAGEKYPELVFGSVLLQSGWMVWFLGPFHRLYSRILLASAKVNLLDLMQHQQHKK